MAKVKKSVIGTAKAKPSPIDLVSSAPVVLPFSKMNYILMLGSIGILLLGFVLLSLDEKFVDAKEFSVSTTIAPIVLLIGYVAVIFAIFYDEKPEVKES